jgi:hypothetical protein
MSLLLLLLLPLLGGLLAWQSERFAVNLPRWITLATLVLALIYLLSLAASLPAEDYLRTTVPSDPGSWLLHARFEWIPRFGIAFELAMDGLSLLLIVLTLLLGLIAVSASWSEVEERRLFPGQPAVDHCRRGRRIPGPGPAAVLPVLGSHAGPHVPADRDLGAREPRLCGDEVLYLYPGLRTDHARGVVALAFAAARQTGAMSFSYFDLLLLQLDPTHGLLADARLLYCLYR